MFLYWLAKLVQHLGGKVPSVKPSVPKSAWTLGTTEAANHALALGCPPSVHLQFLPSFTASAGVVAIAICIWVTFTAHKRGVF
jgi:hypothetical protein